MNRLNTEAPPNRTKVWILLIVGAFMCVCIMCCGSGVFFVQRSHLEAQQKIAQQRIWQIRRNDPFPEAISNELRSPVDASENEERPFALFRKWISEQKDTIPVDLDRMATEIARTQISANVNWMNAPVVGLALRQTEFEPPSFGDGPVVTSADWIVPGEEARVVVCTPSSSFGISSVFVLWLVKRNESWLLYDWKDILDPLTNAEFLGAYYQGNARNQQAIDDVGEEVAKIFGNSNSSNDKAKAIWRVAQRAKVVPEYRDYTNFLACQYIIALGEHAQLSEILKQLPRQPGKLFYEFLVTIDTLHDISLNEIDSRALFNQAKRFISLVGWYPGLGSELLEYAKTPDQVDFCKKLAIRDIAYLTSSYYVPTGFLTAQDVDALWGEVMMLPDPQRALIRLADCSLTDPTMQTLIDRTAHEPNLQLAHTFLEAHRYVQHENWSQALPLLRELHRTSPTLIETNGESLESMYSKAVLRAGSLSDEMHQALNPDKLLSHLQQELLFGVSLEENELKQAIAEWLKLVTDDAAFTDQAATHCLQAENHLNNGQTKQAIDVLLNVLKTSHLKDELESEYLLWKLYELLGEALHQGELWREHREAIDNSELVLFLFHQHRPIPHRYEVDAAPRVQDWVEMLAWYQQKADAADNVWHTYFSSQLAYYSGDWATADAKIAEAIAMTKGHESLDELIDDDTLVELAPFEYFGELAYVRAEMAFRCKHVSEWLAKIGPDPGQADSSEAQRDFEDNLRYTISTHVDQLMSPTEFARLAEDLDAVRKLNVSNLAWLELEHARHHHDWKRLSTTAQTEWVRGMESEEKRDSLAIELIEGAVGTRNANLVTDLHATLGPRFRTELDFANLLVTGKRDKGLNGKLRPEIAYRSLFQSIAIEERSLQSRLVNPGLLQWSDAVAYQGSVLLDQTLEEFDPVLLSSAIRNSIQDDTKVTLNTIVQSDGQLVWRIGFDTGFVLMGLRRPIDGKTSFDDGFVPVKIDGFQSALSIAVVPYSQMNEPKRVLISMAKVVADTFPSAVGFWDEECNGLLVGTGWLDSLKKCTHAAFDPRNPGPAWFQFENAQLDKPEAQQLTRPEVGETRSLSLRWGSFSESMSVKVIELRLDGSYIVEFQNDSKIDPRLSRGWIVSLSPYML